MKMETIIFGTLDVLQDAFECRYVDINRSMHVETYLLHCIGDVGTGEIEVL